MSVQISLPYLGVRMKKENPSLSLITNGQMGQNFKESNHFLIPKTQVSTDERKVCLDGK